MHKYHPIGIIGGMGPQATILLQQRLVDAVLAKDDADHIPLFIDMNPQVPSRIRFLLEGVGEDPRRELIRMARRLESIGSQAIVMPCNTAHHFAREISHSINIPFFNMIDLTCSVMARQLTHGQMVGILASPATQAIKLFDRSLEPFALRPVYADDRDALLSAIRSIKSQGADENARRVLINAAEDCIRKGAKRLIVGCSEFSIIANQIITSVPIVDTLDVLVSRICEFVDKRRTYTLQGACPNNY